MRKVVLKRKISPRVVNGHPWIFANEIDLMDDELEAGDTALVETHDGQFVGYGYVNPISRIPVRILSRKEKPSIINFFTTGFRMPGSTGNNWAIPKTADWYLVKPTSFRN